VGVGTPVLVAFISAAAIALWEEYWTGTAAPSATEVRLFTPENLALFKTISRDHGTCSVASNVNPVPEAHRCSGETPHPEEGGPRKVPVTYIYDPCWGFLETELHCAGDPWTREVTIFRVRTWTYSPRSPGPTRTWRAGTLPPQGVPPLVKDTKALRSAPPWAIELSNGWHCIFVSGATSVLGGERANYLCTDEEFPPAEDATGWVIGFPDRKRSPWIVRFMENKGRQAHEAEVYVAWY
jgi:hypothetical protein